MVPLLAQSIVPRGGAQRLPTGATDAQRVLVFELARCAQRLHRRDRGEGVGAAGEAGDARLAARKGVEDHRTVRDRFVAGNPNRSSDRSRGME